MVVVFTIMLTYFFYMLFIKSLAKMTRLKSLNNLPIWDKSDYPKCNYLEKINNYEPLQGDAG